MRGTPWEPVPGRGDDAIPVRVRFPEEGDPAPNPDVLGEPKPDIKRRARISREDVVRIGFSLACPGCTAISRNAPPQNHTEECRARIEKALLEEGGIRAKFIKEGQKRFEHHKSKRKSDEVQPQDSDQQPRKYQSFENNSEQAVKREREHDPTDTDEHRSKEGRISSVSFASSVLNTCPAHSDCQVYRALSTIDFVNVRDDKSIKETSHAYLGSLRCNTNEVF